MSNDKCTNCGGTGRVTKTTTENNLALGIALGTMYFPRTVTKRVNCTSCGGTGKRR